jgi:hypothetical protein
MEIPRPTDWVPGLPGWYNVNATLYIIVLVIIFTLPITLPLCYKVYNAYQKKKAREERARKKEEDRAKKRRSKKKRKKNKS